MKKFLVWSILFFMVFGVFGASNQKPWLWINLICASNNLEKFGLSDVNEMESAYDDKGEVNIVVVLDRISGYSSDDGDWKGTKIFAIHKDNDRNKITSPELFKVDEVDMGNPNELKPIIGKILDMYKPKHLIVTYWNHGSSILEFHPAVSYNQSRGVLHDDESGNNLALFNLRDIARYIYQKRGGVRTDIFEFDACLVGHIETAYEFADYVDYTVFSEETEPGDGNPYDLILHEVNKYKNISAEGFGKIIVDKYIESYKDMANDYNPWYGKTVITKSMTDNRGIVKIAEYFDEILQDTKKDYEGWEEARNHSEKFAYKFVKDFYSVLDNYRTKDKDVRNKIERLKGMIEDYVYAKNWNGEYCKGISIYFPDSKSDYKRTDFIHTQFGQDTDWVVVLDGILNN